MKVLILNGSPRPDGDTAQILRRLKDRFPRSTDVETIDAFEEGIRPCSDCRYCWENEGCCIRDGMDLIAKDDYDVVVLASPLYMSFVTPPLFSVISRLNAIWSNRYFGIRTEPLKPKKGILVLTGGGDGSPDPAIRIAKTAFRFLYARFDPETDLICSLNTNEVPVDRDPELAGQIEKVAEHLSEDEMDGVQD